MLSYRYDKILEILLRHEYFARYIELQLANCSLVPSFLLLGLFKLGLVWFSSSVGNRQVELELWWEFFFRVQSIGEVYSSNSTVGVDLYSQGLNIVGTISSSCEIRQVELNLIPSFIQSHGHGTDEWLDSGRRLVVGGSESSSDVLVIEDSDFESEVFL